MSVRNQKLVKLVETAVLTAIVLICSFMGTVIRIGPTNIALTLIPIVLGAILIGPSSGAWLGFIFGAVTYIYGGVMGTDPFTATLFEAHPFFTALCCFGKGILCGLTAGLVFYSMKRKPFSGSILAAATAPIVNTGVFILTALLMSDTLQQFLGEGETVFYFLLIICAGWNFIGEFLLNLIVSPALYRLYIAIRKRVRS